MALTRSFVYQQVGLERAGLKGQEMKILDRLSEMVAFGVTINHAICKGKRYKTLLPSPIRARRFQGRCAALRRSELWNVCGGWPQTALGDARFVVAALECLPSVAPM